MRDLTVSVCLVIDDETDMAELEAAVRAIQKDGLVWGGSQLIPLGYGIKKLQINVVVEDEKISVSELEEEIQELEDYVQSTDVVSFTLVALSKMLANSCLLFLRLPCRSCKGWAGDALRIGFMRIGI